MKTSPVLVKKAALAAPVRAAAPTPKPVSPTLPKGADNARRAWDRLFGGAR